MDVQQVGEDGRNILATVRATRTLFEDISKILLTADAMMRERGWEARAANTCMADLSRTTQSPNYGFQVSCFGIFGIRTNLQDWWRLAVC
jgi:hypothetical protein